MTAGPQELMAYHVGFVVRDVEAVASAYQRMLGVEQWHFRDIDSGRTRWVEPEPGGRLRFAWGRIGGLSIELIQVIAGRTHLSEFLDTHGEGMHHLGFWTPDVRAAAEAAVAEGATVAFGHLDDQGNAVVQLTPKSAPEAIAKALSRNDIGFIDPGVGGALIEFVGPGRVAGMREWLGQDFSKIVVTPPWGIERTG